MDRLKVFVLGHSDELLAAVPDAPHLVPTDLRSLTVPDPFNTNLLAENRFLLSDEATQASAEYIGLGSANWATRFPTQLPLADLDALAPMLKKNRVFAPLLSRNWRDSEEEWHPGMTKIVDEVAAQFGLSKQQRVTLCCNAFICHREKFAEFLAFWREAWAFVYDRYGFEFPFTYRCPTCGNESDDGIGRYQASRHAGFVGENLTMLWFANQTDLQLYNATPRFVQPPFTRTLRATYWSIRGR